MWSRLIKKFPAKGLFLLITERSLLRNIVLVSVSFVHASNRAFLAQSSHRNTPFDLVLACLVNHIFILKVIKQEVEIEAVAETIVESSENVKDGNEELREVGFYNFLTTNWTTSFSSSITGNSFVWFSYVPMFKNFF